MFPKMFLWGPRNTWSWGAITLRTDAGERLAAQGESPGGSWQRWWRTAFSCHLLETWEIVCLCPLWFGCRQTGSGWWNVSGSDLCHCQAAASIASMRFLTVSSPFPALIIMEAGGCFYLASLPEWGNVELTSLDPHPHMDTHSADWRGMCLSEGETSLCFARFGGWGCLVIGSQFLVFGPIYTLEKIFGNILRVFVDMCNICIFWVRN